MDVVIGYDINEYYAQISYMTEGDEPQTLDFPSRREEGNIELALCKRNGVNQWFCGREAVKKGVAGEGTLVEHLWQLLSQQDTILIDKKEYEVEKLFHLFLGRTLDWAVQRLEEIFGESVTIKAMVITPTPWNDRLRDCMEELSQGLCIPPERIFWQRHEDSLFSFLIHQSQRLLGYETVVLDLTAEQMTAYRVEMNHKTRPIVTTMQKEYPKDLVRKKHYPSIREHDLQLERLDLLMKSYFEMLTEGRIVTALYLVGEGFGGEWYPESLKVFCRNRKVFAGNNLYGKGACLAGALRIWPSEIAEKYLFLGNDMLRYNIGISLCCRGEETYLPLLDAGTNWYDAKAQTEFLMEEPETIELIVTPIDGSGAYTEVLKLPELPKRPFRSYRMSMTVRMQSEKGLFVCVRDEGFGTLYEKMPLEMTYDLVLGGKGKE